MAWMIAAGAIGGALINSSATDKAAGQQGAASGKAIDETQRQYDSSRTDLAPYRQAGAAALERLNSLLGITRGPSTLVTDRPLSRSEFDNEAYLKARPDVAASPLYRLDPYAHYLQESGAYGKTLPGYKLGDFNGSTGGESSPLLRKFSTEDLNADPVYNSGLKFGLDEGTKAIERRAAAAGGSDSGATLKALTRFGNDYGSTKASDAYARFRDNQDATFGKLSGIAGMGSGATTVGVGANITAGSNLANLYTGQGNANAAATIAGSNAVTGGINSLSQYAMLRQLSGGGQRTTPSSSLVGDYGMTT